MCRELPLLFTSLEIAMLLTDICVLLIFLLLLMTMIMIATCCHASCLESVCCDDCGCDRTMPLLSGMRQAHEDGGHQASSGHRQEAGRSGGQSERPETGGASGVGMWGLWDRPRSQEEFNPQCCCNGDEWPKRRGQVE